MTRSASVIAIIPARGGSKGIPRKNIADLGGHPLVAYSIRAAQACETIERVIVSTDDPEIGRIAASYGAEAILRPAEISGDTASLLFATAHVLHTLREKENYRPDVKITLMPTYPFRNPEKLRTTVRMLLSHEFSSVVSYSEPLIHPGKLYYRWADGSLRPIRFERPYRKWMLATGSFGGVRHHPVFDPCRIEPDHVYPQVIIPYWRRLSNLGVRVRPSGYVKLDEIESIDIDEPDDLELARYVLQEGIFDPWYMQ